MIHLIRTIDAHVGGQALRLVTEGVPSPFGASVAQKTAWLRRRADHIRRAIVLEPRGHADLLAAQLVEPSLRDADAGIVFMGAGGYPAMSGHGVMAAAVIAIERGLFFSREIPSGDVRLVFETAAGPVGVRCRVERRSGGPRVDSVSFTNVPAFVQAAGERVRLDGRELRVDVAYAGASYAIVDTEAVGIPLNPGRVADLRRLAGEIIGALAPGARGSGVADRPEGVTGVVFTGPPVDPEAHLRAVAVREGTGVNRSPSGTGMSAVMSVLDAMGLLPPDGPFVQEGLTGSLFRGQLAGRTAVGETPAVTTEIEGTAWITGEHTFYVDEDDPLREGFSV